MKNPTRPDWRTELDRVSDDIQRDRKGKRGGGRPKKRVPDGRKLTELLSKLHRP